MRAPKFYANRQEQRADMFKHTPKQTHTDHNQINERVHNEYSATAAISTVKKPYKETRSPLLSHSTFKTPALKEVDRITAELEKHSSFRR